MKSRAISSIGGGIQVIRNHGYKNTQQQEENTVNIEVVESSTEEKDTSN